MNEKKEYKKYVLMNSILGLGAANGILTVLVFYVKNHKQNGIFTSDQLMNEMIITCVLIGISVTIIGTLFTNRDIKKGKITRQATKEMIDQLIPTMKPFRAIYITVFTLCITTLLSKCIFGITAGREWKFQEGMILIFCLSTVASAVTAYLSITKAAQIQVKPEN